MKKLTVVLPSFNEKGSVEKFIKKVLDQEKNVPGWQINVIVSDDVRSSDGTEEIVARLKREDGRIHYLKTDPGLGVALIKGHQYAIEKLKPDLLAQLDADGQVEIEVLPEMVKTIEAGYNLVLGSRFVKGGENRLSFSRKIFSLGSSVVCRVIMGPWDIKEFTNSARAFTPELFKKINLNSLPWKEKTFIVQPAFLNEAILVGAKYKEIPLIFKDRAEGYSKNKTINYMYDVFSYAVDARFKKLGITSNFFRYSRRAKTLVKFGLVGVLGTIIDFMFYNFLISQFGMRPATSKGFSTELAIINNFTFNNIWTFRYRKTKSSLVKKFLIFNLVSFGGLAIGVLVVKILHSVFGDGRANVMGFNIAFYNLYFFATIPPVMIWNFAANHFITWKNNQD